MKAAEVIKDAEQVIFVNKKGKQSRLQLSPGLTEQEIAALETRLSCPLPEEIQDLLSHCRGFEGFDNVIEAVDFAGDFFFEAPDLLPHGLPITRDSCGNHWVVDLIPDALEDTAIFYVCHDPPVVVFQADSIADFLQEVFRRGNAPWTSEIDYVYDTCSMQIWKDNPAVLSRQECLAGDPELRAFAETLDGSYLFIDLRNGTIGQGFSWGRYGADTIHTRFGEKRLFAYQMKKLTWLQKIFGV